VRSPGSPPRPPRQRRSLRRNQDAFPRRVLTPPPPRTLRFEGAGSSRARHRSRGLPPRPGFRRPFTVRAQGWTARPDRVSDRTRRLSSTSATRNNPRARLRDPPIPGSAHRRRSSPSLRWTGRRPPGRGWGPIRHDDRRIRVAPPASSLQRSSRIVEEGLHLAPAEASRVRGRATLPPGASRHVAPPSRGWHGARTPRERGIR